MIAIVALSVVGVVLAAILVVWWNTLGGASPDVAAGTPVRIVVEEGAGTAEIARKLADEGVIGNAFMFRLSARSADLDQALRAGAYDLETGMSDEAVLEALTEAPPVVPHVDVTVPEGWTVDQMAERFSAETGISADEFRRIADTEAESFPHGFLASNDTGSLEGYLFPKTYRVTEEMDTRGIITMMLDQFALETADIDLSFITERGMDTHDWVTLASMIEREVRVQEEQRLVSSVIHNRLERGMRLEIDATIEYILPGSRPRLLNEHLEIDSPYNTYMYGGLPPGPIAAPGREALEAAADPAETEYLYYVLTDEDGSHTFTETYDEFLDAKARSREVIP